MVIDKVFKFIFIKAYMHNLPLREDVPLPGNLLPLIKSFSVYIQSDLKRGQGTNYGNIISKLINAEIDDTGYSDLGELILTKGVAGSAFTLEKKIAADLNAGKGNIVKRTKGASERAVPRKKVITAGLLFT